jgi:hypothetical protein
MKKWYLSTTSHSLKKMHKRKANCLKKQHMQSPKQPKCFRCELQVLYNKDLVGDFSFIRLIFSKKILVIIGLLSVKDAWYLSGTCKTLQKMFSKERSEFKDWMQQVFDLSETHDVFTRDKSLSVCFATISCIEYDLLSHCSNEEDSQDAFTSTLIGRKDFFVSMYVRTTPNLFIWV